jgi:hypothetical protein
MRTRILRLHSSFPSNGSRHKNYHILGTPNITHKSSLPFTRKIFIGRPPVGFCRYYSLLNNWQLLTRSLLQIWISRGSLPQRSDWKRTSVSTLNPRSDTRKNAAFCTVADVTRCECVTSLGTAEVTWPRLTIARSKRLQLSLSNGKRVYHSAA